MIATIRRCWESEKRLSVILVEDGGTKDTHGFFWLPEQQAQADLALRVEGTQRRFVVQLADPNRYGHRHIERFEMVHDKFDVEADNRTLIAAAHERMERPSKQDVRLDPIAKLRWQVPLYQRLKF